MSKTYALVCFGLMLLASLKGFGQNAFSWPLKVIKINQDFGFRVHPVTLKPDFHTGVDLKADFQPVFSIAKGKVIQIGLNKISGNFIVISHGKLLSHYAHLSRILVSTADSISCGQLVAISGDTGRSTGPHLHFVLSYLGVKISPVIFLNALVAER